MLIIATILIGLTAFAVTSLYVSQQYNNVNIQNQAENIANGLYISVSKNANNTVFIVVNDFNYKGTLYFTAFYVPSALENDTQLITPQFAEQNVYPEILTPLPTTTASSLYFTNLNLMYQGNIELWQVPYLTPIVLKISPSVGYSPVILFFAQIQGMFVEVGYEWL